jgi:hypothetical protein
VLENKRWLERVTGKNCAFFAYPHGAFTKDTMELCENLRFRYAFGLERNSSPITHLSIPRVGIYRPSVVALSIKLLSASKMFGKPIDRALGLARILSRAYGQLRAYSFALGRTEPERWS